ncbi:hypothetical protein [Corallibacter sp.]|uniref:hypothetical protein n=1 Tax=Corallibacter sp. TaxID=2038084 RepID=UPI003AB7E26F
MKTHRNTHTNANFKVTKDISNANGFLLPYTLYNKVKTIATYPVKEFYLQNVPELTDYKFKMHKNAFVNDTLTIQAQLVKQDANGYLVNIIVTKAKKSSKNQETICSALFGFPLEESAFQDNKTAC